MTEHNRDIADTKANRSGWCRFLSFFDSAPPASPAHLLYGQAIDHARFPLYYETLKVPDTPEGRFEILALHVGLIIRRLMQERETGGDTAQTLVDLMITDLDVNLRELGVGDLSVGKQVKRLAGQFNARMDVLAAVFDQHDQDRLAPMLTTNVYHGVAEPNPDHVAALAQICQKLEASLADQPVTGLVSGVLDLPDAASLGQGGQQRAHAD